MPYKVLVLSPVPEPLVKSLALPIAEKYGVPLVAVEFKTVFVADYELVKRAGADADAVLGDYTLRIGIPADVCEALGRAKLIAQPGARYGHIDVEACARRGVPVSTAPAEAAAVAEHAVMLALMLVKRALYAHNKLAEGVWAQGELAEIVGEIYGKTWGIVGMGEDGLETAARAAALGARLAYYDPAVAEAGGFTRLPLDKLLSESDVVSVHSSPAPRAAVIGERELRLMRPSAVLVFVAGAEFVDADAVAEAVREGRIAGAAFDVFSPEPPPPDHPLLRLAREGYNVVLTPHVGGATPEARRRAIAAALENIFRVLAGQRPLNVVNMPRG
ncbi:MAG: hydroxyacid dehydrogenase [Thermoproteus sp.]|nr:hydroxyacid dehydrogenase [Thermoproteus sp.]